MVVYVKVCALFDMDTIDAPVYIILYIRFFIMLPVVSVPG